uniref:Uncharacterized protein n=1 Tax=Parascaris equorum TaxID=6256 RepID=A0A914RFZ0_PAREQ
MSSLTVHRSRVHKIGEDGQPLTSNEYECERCGELFGTSVELSVNSVLFSGLNLDFVRHRHYCLKVEHIKRQRLEKKLKEQASSVADASVDKVDAMAFRPKIRHARQDFGSVSGGEKRSKRQLHDKSTSGDEGEEEEERGGGRACKGSSTKKPKIEYEDLSTFNVL